MANHSVILTWKIPQTEEPGGLQSMGHRVVHDWACSQQQTWVLLSCSEQPSVKQGYRKQRRDTNRNWVLWHWIFDHVSHLGKCCQQILLYLINVLQNLPPEYIKLSSYTLLEHPVFSLGFLWQLVIICVTID